MMNSTSTRKKVSRVILIILLINLGRLLICEYVIPVPVPPTSSPEANVGKWWQDNYVLYRQNNNLFSAPLIWGQRLYLYDVAYDRSYLIKNQKWPFYAFGYNMCFNGEDILVPMGFEWTDPISGDVNILSLTGKKKKYSEMDMCFSAALTKDYVYTIDDFGQKIYRIHRQTLKKEVVLKSEELSFENFQVSGQFLFADDQVKEKLIIKNLITDEQTIFDWNEVCTFCCTTPTEPGKFAVLAGGGSVLEEIDMNDKSVREVAIFDVEEYEGFYRCETCTYRNGMFYFCDVKYDILRVDMQTGKSEVLINKDSLIKDIDFADVSYCKDYIVIEAVDRDCHRKMYIFDYDGNLIRKKWLNDL